MKTQEEKNIQAEKERVNNKNDECDICRYKSILVDNLTNRFYVCRYFHEVLNEPVRAEICFDTFGIAGENDTAPTTENKKPDNNKPSTEKDIIEWFLYEETIPPANKNK